MNCRDCIKELVCRYNDGKSEWCKGNCPHFQSKCLTWIMPHCERCGYPLPLTVTQFRCVNSVIRIASAFEPDRCPNCQIIIDKFEVDLENKTCIVKGWDNTK